ncbi:hypothetical protein NLG42_11040 [Flavobacterium plurextorum]|uniref:hypothetical protein n=1 Tax=Flavobacterium TaxID=237 RepID=UPI00214D7091|nr:MULTISPECIES: hypothetical protein [Flavobacterium]UUW11319.1 hypothetical protein NLG42_11040 [Flavobacterium plurextorum]
MKNKINLKTVLLEELKNRTYKGLKSIYAPLILNVIIANNNFPDELKNCIIDHNMIEDILLQSDFNFLINEFGKAYNEFPEEFQRACYSLRDRFQIDFPKAWVVDKTRKNKVYGKNYRSPRQYFYYQPEFDEIRNSLRELIQEFLDKLGIVSNLQPYEVYASCISFEEKFKLRLEMYVREKNNFPHIFESKPFLNLVDQVDLKHIEKYYEWLAITHKWGNEIDYTCAMQDGEEMTKFIPDFSLEEPVFKYTQGQFKSIIE